MQPTQNPHWIVPANNGPQNPHWIVPANNGPQNLQGFGPVNYGHYPQPNLFNSFVPSAPPTTTTTTTTSQLSNLNITPNSTSQTKGLTPLEKPVYPIDENQFYHFLKGFPTITDSKEKKLIRKTLETLHPESRLEKMKWLSYNLIPQGICYTQIISVLTSLSFIKAKDLVPFFTILQKLYIPHSEKTHLATSKCVIAVGLVPETTNRLVSETTNPKQSNVVQNDVKIVPAFKNLHSCQQSITRKNASTYGAHMKKLEIYEKQLIDLLPTTTYWKTSEIGEINKHFVNIVQSLGEAYRHGMDFNKMEQIVKTVLDLVRKECFSVYPHAFNILVKEINNLNTFVPQVKQLFFQKEFVDEFIKKLESKRVKIEDREYIYDTGSYHRLPCITNQMYSALVSLSSIEECDRENLIKNLKTKLNPSKRDVYEDIHDLLTIFKTVDPTKDDEFWKEFQSKEYSLFEITMFSKKYPIFY